MQPLFNSLQNTLIYLGAGDKASLSGSRLPASVFRKLSNYRGLGNCRSPSWGIVVSTHPFRLP